MVGGQMTVAGLVVPFTTRELYALTARRGRFGVTGRDGQIRTRVDYAMTAARGTLTTTGRAIVRRRGRFLAADGAAIALSGQDATLST
jgi:hypothetical protein